MSSETELTPVRGDFHAVLHHELTADWERMRWQLTRPVWASAGWTPPVLVHAEQWFAPWWPYQAVRRVRVWYRELRARLYLAGAILRHGHECEE